ncbi:alkaline phosphatase family protein [Atopobium deltae]|uniref:Sulfatase N-terminal domain-containing protein n=1 Tax=Atopobium deltae TaxID=1393034 RepID=A0A133XV66_9ACTN|nr:hypothetical protein [Atopobium deltae]KXB34831.1 hypothetical protein HMPREF3192_00726 [Atopobium deltae]
MVEKLRALKTPAVLVFFGDHQPNFSSVYNDAFYQGESDIIHNQRIYHSSYVIWENYPLGASDTSSNHNITTSPNFLAAKLLWHIRAPLTEYQQAQLAIRSKIPALNAFVC